MILVEEGLLGLNRPVQWYIPEFTGEGKDAVMVHHLPTHTSGLRGEEVNAHAKRKENVGIPPPDETQNPRIHEYLYPRYDAPLYKPPGTEMLYCNYNDELLGEIVRRVSGQPLAEFCQERIFEPLGMTDTAYIVPESTRHRIVRRSKDAHWADQLAAFRLQETPWASGGVYSTAMDMATFGQMFLNRGAYGEARILSPASVAEMTRNQIPGISSRYVHEFFPEASWGLSWSVHGNKRCVIYGETLQSPQAFCHTGAGGVLLWVDRAYEIVGIYFSVLSDGGIPAGIPAPQGCPYVRARMDLLINAVTAAIVD
jgi:CubicO group peptidase (beta-lactamase class C family)